MSFLTSLIYVGLSLIVGLILIGASADIIVLDIVNNYLKKQFFSDFSLRIALGLLGILLLLICLQYIQASFRRSRKNKSLTFESPRGKVSITLFAIEDMLKKMLETLSELSHIRVKVCLRKKHVEIITRGILTAEVNLIEFTKGLQEKVKEKIHTLLGEDKKVLVNLEIRKVALEGKKGLGEEQEPEIPFRNYE